MTTTVPPPMPPLVLASSSPYRRQLLQRLGLEFSSASPQVEESPVAGESARQMVTRLARLKARAIAPQHPKALIIASDQVALLGDKILGKPGNRENAMAQLAWASGRRVEFITGLCLYNAAREEMNCDVVSAAVIFRDLDEKQIRDYVDREQPYQCAGAIKTEGLGIALLAQIEAPDPTALIGLPLICLTGMLEAEGVKVI